MQFKNIPKHFPNVQLTLAKPGYHCSNSVLSSPCNVYEFMQSVLCAQNTECVYVITLGNDMKPINYALIDKGSTNQCFVSIPEIIKICLLSNASNCIVVHNHLSSDTPKPSSADDNIARKLHYLLNELQLNLCDFFITSPDSYYSYMEESRAPYDKNFNTLSSCLIQKYG